MVKIIWGTQGAYKKKNNKKTLKNFEFGKFDGTNAFQMVLELQEIRGVTQVQTAWKQDQNGCKR